MSVARAPEESKADDFNQAMSVAMSVILSIYQLNWRSFLFQLIYKLNYKIQERCRHHGDFRVSTSQQSFQAK
jgi:hypothetical protein